MSLDSQSQCETALRRFSEQLKCMICLKLPINANICPFCSALFCYECVNQWLTRPQEEDVGNPACCPHCRKDLQTQNLIKLQCFEKIEDLGPTFEKISDGSLAHPEYTTNLDNFHKPKYTVGYFTFRNFVPKKGPQRVFSKDIIDNFGSSWKLEVWPKGCNTENYWISVYLRLHKGFAGKYEFIIELLNYCPKKHTATTAFEERESIGATDFIDTRTITNNGNATNLNFRVLVRPASFEEQSKLQTNLLQKLKDIDEQFKCIPSPYTFTVVNYWHGRKKDHLLDIEDAWNVWQIGITGSNSSRYLEFCACLISGFSGLYDVHLELTNYEEECAKKINFQHQFIKQTKTHFNMKIRHNQLQEFGFTHFEANYLEIKLSITPVRINLKSLQRRLNDEFDSDSESPPGDGMYYY